MRFAAFDVETPNHLNNRMSAIGITVVDWTDSGAFISDYYYSYVNPETYFDSFNIRLTKIDGNIVKDAPAFPKLWETIEPILDDSVLAAHNAQFDMSVLKQCLNDYGITWKGSVPYCCTVQIGRRLLPGVSHRLNSMCERYGIFLDHHHAGSDSRACAEILLRYIASADIREYIKLYRL